MPLGVTAIAFRGGDLTAPTWTTGAGTLGTFRPGRTLATQDANITVAAADDSGIPPSIALQTGSSLPSGLSLTDNSDGTATISGTPGLVTTGTTTNFYLEATDVSSNTTARQFSITIQPNYFGDSSDGAYSNEND